MSSSVSIIADAFNNLSDCTASFITIIGFKLANKPPSKKFPFGYGRVEFLSALIVAFMVMMFGFEFLKISFSKLISPETVKFNELGLLLLITSIIVKVWLSNFNFVLGNRINSSALKASSLDAKGDVLTSLCVVISFIASQFINLPIDALMGILVSIGIIYSGFNMTKETVSPLLGEAPSKDIIDSITETLMSYEDITDIHDLIVHNYGINKYTASVHAEMPAHLGVLHLHEIADEAERTVFDKLNIHLVIHIDPICVNDTTLLEIKNEVENIIFKNNAIISMHDFRVIGDNEKKNLVFDVVVKDSLIKTKNDEYNLSSWISKEVKLLHSNYNCVITIDKDFNY